MADFRSIRPQATEDYAQLMHRHSVVLPLALCDQHTGSVIDAEGVEIFVVDPNSELDDDHALEIAFAIIFAVNVCGGFEGEAVNG